MFGISFSELLLVGLVALLVLGPERLPGAARTAGLWVGRLKRSFNAIKQEVEREIGADEIRRQLHNEHILSLEQEARKIFTPTQQEATPVQPVEPVAEQTIHAPVAEPAPVVAAVESAPVVAVPPVEPVTPAAAPVAPTPHDPTLPPRAP
ncbi:MULTISPECIES: Sec-independent protein translocase protein TatB [unclassified Pseudomonas]|uniref:Sec-independent protein translocase protein TatB n=1 Tax=Pseudomonas TaxID=286 RepID=UPI0010125B63|nr:MULTISPECIES: Sec-independent protein translocase protein TatB [unclassified Pseudomonas]QAY90329.1 twin-arginine translocase subunit TatB [Pseudomonas sp. ACM7]TFB41615.1 Sec-independent protein translocase subunit TatB [Pseudomonas sp. F01002]